jgi:hypothetical protein
VCLVILENNCRDSAEIGVDMNFHRYSDVVWSGDFDTSHSTLGFIFISNQVNWLEQQEASMVALSSTESQYLHYVMLDNI